MIVWLARSQHQREIDCVVQAHQEAAQGCRTHRISGAIEELIGLYCDDVGAAMLKKIREQL
jgi:hypothetical protein